MAGYAGDFLAGTTSIPIKFTTIQSTGAPFSLSGGTVSVYKAGSTTESVAGVTLTADYDSRTGLNQVVIDSSADGSFYAAGNDFDLVITAGTVNSVSAVGYTVGSFSLENRTQKADVRKWIGTAASTPTVAGVPNVNAKTWNDLTTVALPLVPTVAGRALDVSAGGEAGLDWANIGSPTTTVALSGTTVGVATSLTNAPGDSSGVTTLLSRIGGAITITSGGVNVSGDFSTTMKTSIGTAVAASAVASVTAPVAITSNVKKNQALAKFQFGMTDSTAHAPVTGKTVTCTRSIDGGAFGGGTLANVTEVASGDYVVDFGAGDLNGNVVVLKATAAGCDDTMERIITQP